ncbi:hypothetical protein N7448_006829 [Penicillium atrosanguineum]|uniref:Uncharacterized protein n=1 Tax=Penicillium atrosanguineum TaxID=1132637 RepID=A0A9W9H0B4_9EURO|nr:uncharacterized protein N7443_010590 [Penicillium atrosanguineum]KAJ5132671.1 hypothetical protein N7448_006829 [Penicillium atrosanguineum]KAJ5290337.1 hypothetical protein N7443_010590 [Penicillium atrosanguineum]KAJ5308160.1 hypothetical protein N7476_008816 [Penicillium atrosanguineum]
MANQAQCLYCFESLYASFEDREPASLAAIEALWEQYEQSKELSKFANEEYEQSVNDDEDAEQDSRPKALQIPRIKRLQSQASDSSSTATTPSSTSNTSSNSNLSASTAMTTPSVLSGISKSSEQRYPLFVTWNTLSRSGSKSLRGCIGTFEAKDLAAGLKSYALTSAFDDSRFSPIPKSLLPSLQCALTLLGSFEPCTDAMDWTLGTHGIRISFIHRGRRHGATYLPDVATEQGWTKEETVESLMRKAGWDGGAGSAARKLLRGASSTPFGMKSWEQVSDFKTVRYQGLKAKASYKDWQDWRNWVLSLDDGRDILSLA